MKKIFYLNLENKNFLEQKFWSKKYVKQIKRFKPLKHIFNVDNNSGISPVAFQKDFCGSSIFLNKQKILKVRFSTTLYIKSFLSFEQKKNKQIASAVQKFYKLTKCKKFHTMFLLRPVKYGYEVHTGGIRCFLPRHQIAQLRKRLLRLYKNWKIRARIKIFSDILLPRMLETSWIFEENLFFRIIFAKKISVEKLLNKKSFFLKKLPVFSFAKIKIVPAYKKKNFVKKIYYWRKYTKYVVLHRPKKKKNT